MYAARGGIGMMCGDRRGFMLVEIGRRVLGQEIIVDNCFFFCLRKGQEREKSSLKQGARSKVRTKYHVRLTWIGHEARDYVHDRR